MPAHNQGMEQPRKGQTNEPGHPGHFGHKHQSAPTVTLPPVAETDEFNEWAEHPPTKREVDEAREHMDALAPRGPMYRADWERRNGGYGATQGQHNADLRERNRDRDQYDAARKEYEQMLAAWETSDKSQDNHPEYRCGYCGEWFFNNEGRCPACGNY